MGNIIVIVFVAGLILLVLRALRKEHKESGSCAFCTVYAKSGKCNHVGHEELDHQNFHLTKEEQAILDRHSRNRKKA